MSRVICPVCRGAATCMICDDDGMVPAAKFQVRYYDREMSRRGQGVQVRTFTDRAEAEDFASKTRLYARPAKVEEVSG